MMKFWMSAVLLAGLVVASGCSQPPPTSEPKNEQAEKPKHSGWWCDEHGVPEAECSMCSPKVAKEAKAKGDWCDKHERAKSQCFICDPSLMEKAKIRYKAETGEEMPIPKDNLPEKK